VESENYVHRIGRTARAGKTGRAVTLASEQDVYELPSIERYIGKKIPSEIAGGELYGEDKSAGMRIHTEFFGGESFGGSRDRRDREGRRGEGRDRARGGEASRSPGRRGGEGLSGGRPADGSQAGGSRYGKPDQERQGRRDHSRDGRRNQREAAGPGTFSRKTGPGEAAGSNRGAGGEDISKLSFDQRMAYYKQKYDKDNSSPDRDSRKGERGGRRKEPIRETEAAARNRQEKSAGRGRQGGQRPAPAVPGKAPVPAGAPAKPPSPEKGPAGKGLLGRILGIFRKKK
jgi:ATP-dependent RNA helicase RhlB